MQQHSSRAILQNTFKAYRERKTEGLISNVAKNEDAARYVNTKVCQQENPERQQVRFALIDYRDNNKRLVHRVMYRGEAARMNDRLRNTGFAWAQVGN